MPGGDENCAAPYSLSLIAETGDRFSDFAPYVAAIDNRGGVVFQAAPSAGGSGVHYGDGKEITTVADSEDGAFRAVRSHPDIDGVGRTCFYADGLDGVSALFTARDGAVTALNQSAGPLGPTVNPSGTIAFRSPLPAGGSGLYTSHAGVVTTIADTTSAFSGFHGLPVIAGDGSVVFRADRRDGIEGIYRGDGGDVEALAESGGRFRRFGFFPFANDGGAIVFCAELRSDVTGVFTVSAGEIAALIDTTGPFESFRGALLSGTGQLVFYGTPNGGELSIYSGPDPDRDCLLAVGSPLFDSTVAEFALNPVSINDVGQLAIRVALANGRQLIVRADPGSTT